MSVSETPQLPDHRENQLIRRIREGKNVLTDTEGVLSRFPFTGAQGRISRVPEKSAWAAYWFDEGRTRGVYHFRGSGISLLVCAEHLQHTHSGICTCINRTDYSKPPKSVPPLTSSPSIRQSGSDLRPATPTLTHAPSIILSPH